MPKDDGNRLKAVELAKRLLVDAIWKTANIEVDGITFPDAQEIFEGRAPSNMEVNDIIVVNNIKRAWMFLFENIGRPIDWRYVSEYNRILGKALFAMRENSGPMMCASEEPIGFRNFRPWNPPMTKSLH